MPLTQEQSDAFQGWVNSHKSHSFSCPFCNGNNWALGEIVSAPSFSPRGMVVGGPSVPMVQLICNECHHVLLFAARQILNL